MTNWKQIVDSDKSKRFTLPAGWELDDSVAQDLGCSRERVRHEMAPLVKAGAVEVKIIDYWDRELKRVTKRTAYHHKGSQAAVK